MQGSFLGLLAAFAVATGSTSAAAAAGDVLTQRYDNGRNGRAVDDTITPLSVSDGKWQKLAKLNVSGAVYAQPLVVKGQVMADGSTHDLLVVVTAKNWVYGFDANSYQPLWTPRQLGQPDKSYAGVASQYGDTKWECAQMSPLSASPALPPAEYGIGNQSTPVIDRSAGLDGLGPNGSLYVTYRTNDVSNPQPANAKQWIARLNLRDGTSVLAPTEITAAMLGNQPVQKLRQRSSLLLSNGVLYVAFASHCENLAVPDSATPTTKAAYAYRGAILAFDPVGMGHVGRFEIVPAATTFWGAGVWQASSGIASDGTSLFFTTGNALIPQKNADLTSSAVATNYLPNSFVRLTPSPTFVNGRVTAVSFSVNGTAGQLGYFTPYRSEWHNRSDLDLGSAGVILPKGTSEVIGGGKEGIAYVLNKANLGGYASGHWTPQRVAAVGTGLNAHCITNHDPEVDLLPLCDSTCYEAEDSTTEGVIQKFLVARNVDCATPNMGLWTGWAHVHGTPVFGRTGTTDYLYVWPEKDQLKMFARTGPAAAPYDTNAVAAQITSPNIGMPGGTLTLSSKSDNSSTVIFAAVPLETFVQADSAHPENSYNSINAGGLVAINGAPQGTGQPLKVLWGDYPNDAVPYVHAKFVPPTVANGKVYLATFSDAVMVYGPGPAPVAHSATPIAATWQNSAQITALSGEPSGTIAVYRQANGGVGDWGPRAATINAGAPPNAPVALDYYNGNLVAFVIGADRRLRMLSTPQTGNATAWTTTVVGGSGSSSLMPLGAKLATGRRGTELDVFVIDSTGDPHMFIASTTVPWVDQKIATPVDKFPAGGALVTSPQGPTQLDVVAVDSKGHPKVYFYPNVFTGTWDVSSIPGTLLPGANLATAIRGGSELDVYVIGGTQANSTPSITCSGNDDTGCLKVMSVTGISPWVTTTVSRVGPLIPFAPGVPGAPIAAAPQGSNQIDVFFASQTGAVQVYYSLGTGGWANWPLRGPNTPSMAGRSTLRAMPGSTIAAVFAGTNAEGTTKTVALVPGNRLEITAGAGTSGIFGAASLTSSYTTPFKAL